MAFNRYMKKTLIVAIWLLTVLVAGLVLFVVEGKIFTKRASAELIEQAENVAKQMPSILENNFQADKGSMGVLFSKLEAAAFKLSEYETIEQAKPFLDEFVSVAGIEDLVVLDTDANLLYGRDEDIKDLGLDTKAINILLESKAYELMAQELKTAIAQDSFLLKYYLSSEKPNTAGELSTWGVDNRWLIGIKNTKSEAQQIIQDYFDWRNVIQRINIGNSGFMVAINSENGTILSNPDSSLNNTDMRNLDITIKGIGKATSAQELLNGFVDADNVRTVTMKGTEYLATRLNLDDAIILALLPKSELRASVNGISIITGILLFLTTSLLMLYAMFHLDDRFVGSPRFARHISVRVKMASIIVVSLVLMLSMYTSALFAYADNFRYSKAKANSVTKIIDENQKAVEELKTWFDNEYLTRAKMVKTILKHTDGDKITREYINDLSNLLDIRYTYLFDGDGQIVLTNSRFSNIRIDSESPFRAVLNGKPSLVLRPEYDELMDESFEKVAVSMIDEDGNGEGMLLTYTLPEESQVISNNLGYRIAFRQVSMTNNSFIMVIDSNTNRICYMATVIDGNYVSGDGSFDYTDMDLSSIEIETNKIIDGFNGNIRINKKLYFASIKRDVGHFFLVMKPRSFMSASGFAAIIISVLASSIFSVLLVIVASKLAGRSIKKETSSAHDSPESDIKPWLTEILQRKKLYFEDRWPQDCIKWKAKSASEKFSIASRYVILIALVLILIHSESSSASSIWHYCVKGEWDDNINLYSITNCLMSICILVIAKMVIHKFLFLVARAANPRGETICKLFDSFTTPILFVAGIFICLSNCGVNTKALTLTGGAVGVIFGIGCQTIVADILAGLIMAFEGAIHNGDPITYEGKPEVVQCISVRTIRLMAEDGVKVVRNNEFRNFVTQPKHKQNTETNQEPKK